MGDAGRLGDREGFGYLSIAAGIALFVFQGSSSAAWLAFIGWFLHPALRGVR